MTTLTLAQAQAMAEAAQARSTEIGKPFAVTVVDPGGHVLLLVRQDGVQAAASDVSAAKARAAALFNRPSGALESLMATDGRPGLLALTSVVPGTLGIQGAVPVHGPGGTAPADLLGAIGASGGTPQEDESVAQAGADALPAASSP